MKLNYTLKSIKINSQWFDNMDRKQNVYQKITYKGLYLYFQLYKFRLHNQENEHTFITSISLLRKETGYTTDEIFELLKKMKSAKIIKLENCSRWEYLIDDNGNIKDKDILMITAIDTFPIENFEKDDSRFYIYIPLDLFSLYEQKGLNEKYFALYCLIKKWSQNTEQKAWMSIAKMSDFLGFDKDYINQMIYQMNRNYFLSSKRKKKSSGRGYSFEHYILDNGSQTKIDNFITTHKENMDNLIKRVDKKKNSKKKMDIENELEEIEEVNEQSQESELAFGTRKAVVNKEKEKSWGEDNHFENVSSNYIKQTKKIIIDKDGIERNEKGEILAFIDMEDLF